MLCVVELEEVGPWFCSPPRWRESQGQCRDVEGRHEGVILLSRGGLRDYWWFFFPLISQSGENGCRQERISCSYSYFVVCFKQIDSLVLYNCPVGRKQDAWAGLGSLLTHTWHCAFAKLCLFKNCSDHWITVDYYSLFYVKKIIQ